MAARPRPPDPGSLAALAAADQRAAAHRDTLAWAAALVHDGALLVPHTGPWAARAFASVQPHRWVTRCPHIDRARGHLPMAIPARGHLACRGCLASTAVELDWRFPRCRSCDTPRPGVLSHRVHVAQLRHVLAYGRLCFTCSTIEHDAIREAR